MVFINSNNNNNNNNSNKNNNDNNDNNNNNRLTKVTMMMMMMMMMMMVVLLVHTIFIYILSIPVTAAERSIGSFCVYRIGNFLLTQVPSSPSSSCSSVFLCFFLPSDAYYAIVVKKDNFDACLFDQLKRFVHLTAMTKGQQE